MTGVERVASWVQTAIARPGGASSSELGETVAAPPAQGREGKTSTAKFRKFHKFISNPTRVVWLLKNDLIFAISQREGTPN